MRRFQLGFALRWGGMLAMLDKRIAAFVELKSIETKALETVVRLLSDKLSHEGVLFRSTQPQ